MEFCRKDPKRALKFETRDVANFAAKLFQQGGSWAVVSAAITALDETGVPERKPKSSRN